ncbi:MAG: DUF2442 domain-containing protein [Sulfuricella sp.]|nr:DUF2442 domain-containing protein [Sulfuricella sp.]
MNPRVATVVALENHKLMLTFTNGEVRVFDVAPYLDAPVFQPLRNPGYFSLAKVVRGTVTWPNEADFCPDTLYELSIPQQQAA